MIFLLKFHGKKYLSRESQQKLKIQSEQKERKSF